jgi:glycosyltransferase involved in cell wall biosynthesis
MQNDPLPRPVVFDLRAGTATGIGRVAMETVAAYRAAFPRDPVTVLTGNQGRYAVAAQREWPALRRRHPGATWVWFHWDVPLVAPPVRSVVYLHDLINLTPAFAPWRKRVVAGGWIRRACTMASRVVTVSEAVAAELSAGMGVEATVIPNGVSTHWALPWAPQDYLLTVGEPRRYKNFGVAEQVAAALGVRHRHAWRVTDAELAALYAGARVVLIPSRVEGFGLPLLEAFAAGVPVVASDIPALREVSGGLVRHVAPNDLPGWCQAVQALWRTGGQDGAAEAMRRARAASFTWERAARLLRQLLLEIG